MTDKKFKDVQVGDWIWTIKCGWVKITNFNGKALLAKIETHKFHYHITGVWADDLHPSAWTYNPFDKDDKPPYEFKEGEVIAVRDDNEADWSFDQFTGMEDAAQCFGCRTGARKYARKQTAEERGE